MEVPPTAFIMGWMEPRRTTPEGLLRTVGTSRFAFGTEVSRPRTLLCSSSGLKLCGSIQVPASIPAIFKPARASGSTATPPAAPRPITATSTGFRLMAIVRPQSRPAVRLDCDFHLLVFGRDGNARPGIADHLPAAEVGISAVVGIAEHAFQRQAAEPGENGTRVGEVRGRALFHGGDDAISFLWGQLREPRILDFTCVGIHLGETLQEAGFLVGESARKRLLDVVDGAAFQRTRAEFIARNQASDERFERSPFRRGENSLSARRRGRRGYCGCERGNRDQRGAGDQAAARQTR